MGERRAASVCSLKARCKLLFSLFESFFSPKLCFRDDDEKDTAQPLLTIFLFLIFFNSSTLKMFLPNRMCRTVSIRSGAHRTFFSPVPATGFTACWPPCSLCHWPSSGVSPSRSSPSSPSGSPLLPFASWTLSSSTSDG